MRSFFYWQLLGLAMLAELGASYAGQAQTTARPATRIDSLRAARDGKPTYYPAVFTFASGKQVKGYVDGYSPAQLDRVECYERPPDQLPRPVAKAISIERLKSMVVDGHTMESLYVKGKPLKILAENMTPAGGLQTFGYAITKADMFIPIPVPGLGAGFIPVGSHDKYFWFVRPPGGQLQEVPRGDKAFAALIATAFADYPELAARVRQRAAGTEFKNMPELVKEYNAHFAAK
jgi:hypothetical protein